MLGLPSARLGIKVHHVIAIGHGRGKEDIQNRDHEADSQKQPPHGGQHAVDQQVAERVFDIAGAHGSFVCAPEIETRGAEAVGHEEAEEPDAAVYAHEFDASEEAGTLLFAAFLEPVADGAAGEEGDFLAAQPRGQDVAAQDGDGEVGRHELPGHGAALALDVAGWDCQDDLVDAQ